MKREIAIDFVEQYKIFEEQGILSVNKLCKHYNVSNPIIIRWLEQTNLVIEKSNKKYEERLDLNLEEFKKDCESNLYFVDEIKTKYNVNGKIIYMLCARNNINCNFKKQFDPNIDELINLLYKTKRIGEVAKHYNVTRAVLNDFLKKIKFDTSKIKEDIGKEIIESYVNKNYSHSMICEELGITPIIFKRLLKKYNIKIDNQFDLWKNKKDCIQTNFDYYVELNKTKTLLDISKEENISLEQLKYIFRQNETSVILHSYNKSKGELELKDYIRSLGFNCISIKPKNNDRVYEIDCFIPELNLGIEYCGEWWHSINSGKEKKYHQDKYFWALEQNIELITIFETEWLNKTDIVKSIINNKLKLSKKIYARNTIFKPINNCIAKTFHDKNHINGYINSSLNFGLFYNDELVSVLSLSKSRFDKKYNYEITRFSSILNTTVIGGFSKLLKNCNLKSIITYADLRFGSGDVYLKNGFNKLGTTPPNYKYFKKCFENRMKFQKHKLTNMKYYSEDKTEQEIMLLNNYLIIYDCGNNKYELI